MTFDVDSSEDDWLTVALKPQIEGAVAVANVVLGGAGAKPSATVLSFEGIHARIHGDGSPDAMMVSRNQSRCLRRVKQSPRQRLSNPIGQPRAGIPVRRLQR